MSGVRLRGEHYPSILVEDVPKHIRVWLFAPEAVLPPRIPDYALTCLDDEEIARYRGFWFDRDRRAYLAAHALRRFALAGILHAPPETIRFRAEPTGRPIVTIPSAVDVWTSLSRRRGLVGVAVSSKGPVGLDIEETARADDPEALLAPFLTPITLARTVADIRANPAAFAGAWTLTEAFAKLTGTGLTEMAKVDITEIAENSFELSSPGVQARARCWAPDPRHRVSVAWFLK